MYYNIFIFYFLNFELSTIFHCPPTVETAQNGGESVESFVHSTPNKLTSILRVTGIPVMDGLESTHAIRDLEQPDAKNILIIAMTANAFEEDKAIALSTGMTSFLINPINIKLVLQELKNFRLGQTKLFIFLFFSPTIKM